MPPLIVTPGYCGEPSRLMRNDSASAFAADMMNVTPSTAMLFVAKCVMSPMMSAIGFVVAAAVGAPLVIDAGLTPATAATAGSMNWLIQELRDPRDHVLADQRFRAGIRELDQFLREHDDARPPS